MSRCQAAASSVMSSAKAETSARSAAGAIGVARDAGVPQDDGRPFLRVGEIREGFREEGIAAALDARDPDEPRLAEQRGRGDGEERAPGRSRRRVDR